VTIDEELEHLDSNLRKLKIEYEIYFSSPNKRPPTELEWRVANAIRKCSDGTVGGQRMSLAQRYRYNELAQRYALLSDLWRKKARIKEEGYRRPQDALLAVQGVRPTEASSPSTDTRAQAKPFTVAFSQAGGERDNVELLFKALTDAKRQAGMDISKSGSLESFASFVKNKTDQIRKEHGCQAVEYSVEMQDGQVRLKARAKT
jgi:hypothetical protein